MAYLKQESTISTKSSYLLFLFNPFFRYWWAALTGCASILAMYVTPSQGITLNGAMIMTITFIVLILLFITLSTVSQGYQLYIGQLEGLCVSSLERNRDVSEGRVFILNGDVDLPVGSVIDVHKRMGEAEVPLALIRINSRNSKGAYQATPIGKMNPSHIKEHSNGGLRPMNLVVRTSVDLQRVKEVLYDLR
jgi:hypothetical protein